jgi:3-oxoacyl-[acyl-carrier protein] reductase
MTTEIQMAGQVALVTGSSRGIGRAIAMALAALGMKVIGTATTDAGATAITEGLTTHVGSKGIKLDVTDGAAVDAAIDGILKEHGALHVVVNNAGITRDMLSMRMTHHQHHVGGGRQRKCRAGELRRCEGRRRRHDAVVRP